MLAIRPSKPSPSTTTTTTTQPPLYTPHLLPAHISHTGPINSSTNFFTPSPTAPSRSSTDPKPTTTTTSQEPPSPAPLHAHLRGRHLTGTPLPLPATHTGAVLVLTDAVLPPSKPLHGAYGSDGEDEEDEEEEDVDMEGEVEVKVAEQVGRFDEVVVWGHGGEVGEGDRFRRGVEEWVGWAGAMHGEEDE